MVFLCIMLGSVIVGVIFGINTADSLPRSSFGFYVFFTGFMGGAIGYVIAAIVASIMDTKEGKDQKQTIAKTKLYLYAVQNRLTDLNDSLVVEKLWMAAKAQGFVSNQSTNPNDVRSVLEQSKAAAKVYAAGFYDHIQRRAKETGTRKIDLNFISWNKRSEDLALENHQLMTLYQMSENTDEKIRAKELEKKKQLNAFTQYTGREKRIAYFATEAAELTQRLKNLKPLSSSYGQQKEVDWAVAGGIASAIGGAGAGVAAALDAQSKNASIREQNARAAQNTAAINNFIYSHTSNLEDALKNRQRLIEESRAKLLGTETAEEVMRDLSVECTELVVSPTGAVHVTASVKLKRQLTIRDGRVPAVADGVLYAQLKQNGIRKGSAYITLPCYGIGSATNPTKLEGICTELTDPNAKYTVEFEPYHLWLMER